MLVRTTRGAVAAARGYIIITAGGEGVGDGEEGVRSTDCYYSTPPLVLEPRAVARLAAAVGLNLEDLSAVDTVDTLRTVDCADDLTEKAKRTAAAATATATATNVEASEATEHARVSGESNPGPPPPAEEEEETFADVCTAAHALSWYVGRCLGGAVHVDPQLESAWFLQPLNRK
jgi:ribosomal protein L12E/L44/L45/RPP1/RPP2